MTNDAIFPINFPERSSRANFLGGAAIATCCQRQGCISMSTEAELVALAACAIELICTVAASAEISLDRTRPLERETHMLHKCICHAKA